MDEQLKEAQRKAQADRAARKAERARTMQPHNSLYEVFINGRQVEFMGASGPRGWQLTKNKARKAAFNTAPGLGPNAKLVLKSVEGTVDRVYENGKWVDCTGGSSVG